MASSKVVAKPATELPADQYLTRWHSTAAFMVRTGSERRRALLVGISKSLDDSANLPSRLHKLQSANRVGVRTQFSGPQVLFPLLVKPAEPQTLVELSDSNRRKAR